MAELSEKKKGIAEPKKKITTKILVENIPAEKRWAITAKALTGFSMLRGAKTLAPLLGTGEGIFAPVMGLEKYKEIAKKIWAEGAKKFYPWVKETFNIPVEDAIGGTKLAIVAAYLSMGPEWEIELVEETLERAVTRNTKCPYWERYKELEIHPELTTCVPSCNAWVGEGLKVINPKITLKPMKNALPLGDSYCEFVSEFKKE